ncbi:MAG TPA: DUF3024 domain-containing protein [Methylotenera sp.]|nr:DUF3024 domain-containing protein [Methylotenera sp.]HPH04909.1 DUF3024 domain-containing protein [Methylotenera sp.]
MMAAHIQTDICPHPNEVDRKRIEKTLAERERYKYVAPKVLADVEGYLVRSPCCSRSVDPEGGEIDIARIEYQSGDFWRLYQKDDEHNRWKPHSEYLSLYSLLARLIADPKKEFWR